MRTATVRTTIKFDILQFGAYIVASDYGETRSPGLLCSEFTRRIRTSSGPSEVEKLKRQEEADNKAIMDMLHERDILNKNAVRGLGAQV